MVVQGLVSIAADRRLAKDWMSVAVARDSERDSARFEDIERGVRFHDAGKWMAHSAQMKRSGPYSTGTLVAKRVGGLCCVLRLPVLSHVVSSTGGLLPR